MGITKFTDITRTEFLKTYLGINNASVLNSSKVEKDEPSGFIVIFEYKYWIDRLHNLHKSLKICWKTIQYTAYDIYRSLLSSQPLAIDWRTKVRIDISIAYN